MGFWDLLEGELSEPLTPEVRRFCELEGRPDQYESAGSSEARRRVVIDAASTVRHLYRARLAAPKVPTKELGGHVIMDDERWLLWRELLVKANEGELTTWRPFHVGMRFTDVLPGLLSELVFVEFDNRLPLATVMRAVREAWKELESHGDVRSTRPLRGKAIALLRFVCLDSEADLTWERRVEAWNEAQRETHPEWVYEGDQKARKMHSDFRGAEERLSGRKDGLRWAYDSFEWTFQRLSVFQRREIMTRSDPEAEKIKKRIRKEDDEYNQWLAAEEMEARRMSADLS
jgi:hypothetical protein